MSMLKKFGGKTVKEIIDESYDDDFEEYDFADEVEGDVSRRQQNLELIHKS